MNYAYRIQDVAAAELLEAALWYERKREGLGDAFMLCFEAAIQSIRKNPFLFQLRYKNCRFAGLERFPYYLIFYVDGNLITVIGCFHAKRNPKIWKRRTRP